MFSEFYVIATPIGNLEDITIRALKTLRALDYIICEDTRRANILLNHYHIKKKFIVCNEYTRADFLATQVLDLLKSDKKVGLISDAGTPIISDPGYELLQFLIANNIKLIPIPGANAAATALSAAGIAADKFLFLGFLPRKKKTIENLLKPLKNLETTIIIYESPKRVRNTLQILLEIFGDCKCVVCRELTKIYETISRGKISEFINSDNTIIDKGEFVILVDIRNSAKNSAKFREKSESYIFDPSELDEKIKRLYNIMTSYGLHSGLALRALSETFDIKKNTLYKHFILENKNTADE